MEVRGRLLTVAVIGVCLGLLSWMAVRPRSLALDERDGAGAGPTTQGSVDAAATVSGAKRIVIRTPSAASKEAAQPSGGLSTDPVGETSGAEPGAGRTLESPDDEVAELRRILGPTFTVTETRHFVVLSDCGRDWTRARADLLERTHHQFMRMMEKIGLPSQTPEHKLPAIMFNEHAAYQAFAKSQDGITAPWVAGYYAAKGNRIVFYNDSTAPAVERASRHIEEAEVRAEQAKRQAEAARRERNQESVSKLERYAAELSAYAADERERIREHAREAFISKSTHEAAHLVAFNCGFQLRSRQYPFWLTEGVAQCFETTTPNRAFGPDQPVAEREREFERILLAGESADSPGLLPLDVLVSLNEVPGGLTTGDGGSGGADAAAVMYPQSYALFRYLFRFHREALAGYVRDIAGEPPGRISPERHLVMFSARFGDVAALERQWLLFERTNLESGQGEDRERR